MVHKLSAFGISTMERAHQEALELSTFGITIVVFFRPGTRQKLPDFGCTQGGKPEGSEELFMVRNGRTIEDNGRLVPNADLVKVH